LRTRAETVARHLPDLIERFATPDALAREEPHAVEEALRPLGLKWRARRLHELAEVIVANHRGQVPLTYDELVQLPGVGPYVASTTLAASTERPVVLTDTNTVRVAARVSGLHLKGDIRRRKDVQHAISRLMNGPAELADWLAVLDLAATVCLPRNPRCFECPIGERCCVGSSRHG
jgi:A/G-specific adenine glycosylase